MTTQQLIFLRAGATAAGVVVLFALESVHPFFRGRSGRVRHGARNLAFGLFNAGMVALLFAGPLASAAEWAESNEVGLTHWVGLPAAGAVVLGVVVFDAWMYWWHRANHRIGLLWRFHRMHHSEPDLDVTTAMRFHTGEIAISSGLRLGVLVLVGMSFKALIIYEIALLPVIQFHHSNVRIPYRFDRALRKLLVSPNMHRLHHSVLRREHDGNYASIFSFWDRAFGSYRRRDEPGMEDLQIGLKRWSEKRWLGLWGMLKTPLR